MNNRGEKVFFYILIIISMLSCNEKREKAFDYRQNMIYVEGEPLPIEQLIGRPYAITCMDSLLIYYDRYDGKLLSVFNLKSNHFVGRFVTEGQGPNDAFGMLYLLSYPQKDRLHIYQRAPGILRTLDIQDFRTHNTIPITSSPPTEMQRAKDFYIGMGIFDEGRFSVYDVKGELLYIDGNHPYDGKDMEPPKAFLIYQGPFCANPDKNYFVSACAFNDHISFYEVAKNEIIMLCEYGTNNSNVGYDTNGLILNDDCTINYTWAYGTASYCYMLFSGKTYADNRQRVVGGNYIIAFDWQGNYIKTLHTDFEIRSFCVDEANTYIYALAQREDGDIVIIKLKI